MTEKMEQQVKMELLVRMALVSKPLLSLTLFQQAERQHRLLVGQVLFPVL
ncbi:hypothetical protein LLDT2_07420 [Lactococcus lactis subsp. lactis bv. diacetylactis str. TIFN2]|nr:hypothetical protein LLDT2_07420 [Lactococcus lactis subsp. lactis bv. diacetylactis str. TIFN2]